MQCVAVCLSAVIGFASAAVAQRITYPPKLPGGKTIVSDTSAEFLKPPASLKTGIAVAKTPPTVDFLFFPGQNYPGKPWSNWGDGTFADGKYYTAIGDHYAIGGRGNVAHGTGTGFVYEYDPRTKKLRTLVNTSQVLKLPKGHYTPGKIHSRIDLGNDGWLYFATHRGSKRATVDRFHYRGDWIFRSNPKTGKTEVVVRGPVRNHAVPTSTFDPQRLIFYGGTAAGMNTKDDKEIRFFAYDCQNRKMLYNGPDGPARYLAFARSTGRVYYVPGNRDGQLMRFDPRVGKPQPVTGQTIGMRAATVETKDGRIYTVSIGQRSADAAIWSLNTKTERVEKIGTAAVGSQAYVASIDVDPTGRYLYYVPGAHGGGSRDGTPVVQFDVTTGRKKVIAFLHPYYQTKYGFTLKGTYSTAVDAAGDKLYVTFNVSRGSRAWDCCGLAVVHIPKSERTP
ncbi:MAG: YncE family protein [Planctomycetaceae bacterium]